MRDTRDVWPVLCPQGSVGRVSCVTLFLGRTRFMRSCNEIRGGKNRFQGGISRYLIRILTELLHKKKFRSQSSFILAPSRPAQSI